VLELAGILEKERLRLHRLAVSVMLALVGLVVVSHAVQSWLPAGAQQPVNVSGVVFVDDDGDGVRDNNESGVENVSVSDGKTIVQTDASGGYTLATNVDRRLSDIVFVSVPSGFSVPPDEFKTPSFYRNLGQLAPDAAPIVDFGLTRAPVSNNPNFSFVNLADVHVEAGTANNRERFTSQIAQLNQLTGSPAFVQVSGDLTNRATDAEFVDYKASTATSRLPVWPAMGNHEYGPGPDYRTRIDNYRRHLGPEWYSFTYGQRHFIVLENNSAGWGEADQLAWLRRDLELNAQDREVVVFVHKPLNTPQTVSGTKPFIDLLDQYNTVLVLMGHTHVNDVELDTIPGADHVVTNSSAYTIDQTPNGFRQVNFHGGRLSHAFKMYDVERSLTLVNPAPGARVEQGRLPIQINAYHTSSSVDSAEYRVDGSPWHKLDETSHFTWAGEWDGRREALSEHQLDVRVKDDGAITSEESARFQLVAPGSLSTVAGGADWTMFHGNAQHTGAAQDVLGPDLRLAWSARTPGTILTSSPAIVDGAVYVGVRDEDGEDHNAVHAVDLATGRPLWQFKSDAQVQASPAVEGGMVYASSVRGTVYAIDARTGGELWNRTVPDDADGVRKVWMYYSPTVANGVVYQGYSVGGNGFLMALNAASGELLWNSRTAGGWVSESSPVVADGKVYVGGDGGETIAFDAATGARIWSRTAVGEFIGHSMPAISDGRVFKAFNGGWIAALDAQSGALLWRYRSPGESHIPNGLTGSSPAVVDGVAYVGFPDGRVAALRAETGEVLWQAQTGHGVISSPLVSGDTVFIGSNDGFLYAFSRQTGQQLRRYEIGAWVASSPAISGNTLVVGAFDGNLYAFTPE
jgi:outer membrane protein assembly factor BamB